MIVGVLLAAGSGVRFGGDKLLAAMPAPGAASVGVTSCRNLREALADVVAVVRPGDDALAAAFAALGVRVVRCANADNGMGASLACGVRATGDADGWVVALADMPWVRDDTIRAVAAAVRGGAVVAAPFHRGERGHPVGFGKACGPALMQLTGDTGARAVLAAHRDALVAIAADDAGVLRDIDRPQDLA